ncbi:phosphate/phosphite/phosphonate ABC transporter substrate-binding protein [Leifsonia sp. fls2-241-R2A-40a]|uniref:phosphate/phosphite/phosphonate ABC transporter substrate-binding protein n=1 Tax=Leifsonia sp. fls2-241-R2A-40a TaxID=3040290 RepID=UPI00254D004D|nr:phosphate/phosphite/phosphonate ABC transporter substrate-binding protein [Leifsonia sp. fls2-241-R2A-40a]
MKLSLTKTLAVGAALVLSLGLAACTGSADAASTDGASDSAVSFAKDSGTLVFGVVPDTVNTQSNYQPIADYIAKITGKKVEYRESSDYTALIQAAIAGQIDVASFSGFTYVTATNGGAKIQPFASIITKEGQEPGYFSEAIVPANSKITKLEDFKGKKVCFVDPSSTSGYLFPTYNLIKAGIDPEKDITPVFAGKHDASALKVSQGAECDAGFAEDSAVDAQSGLKVVAKTMVPGAPMVFSTTLPDDVKKTLTDKLSTVTIADIQKAGIKDADSDGFKATFAAFSPVDDKYYDQIRDICKVTKATQCEAK